MAKTMNDEEWAEKFKPIKNPHLTNGPWNGEMFETYGPELESVRAADPACVWTLVSDGDDDAIVKGYHHVNRMGYFITAVPADDETPDEIDIVD